jgi:hypothetical protein
LGALALTLIFACAPSTDPVDMLCDRYDGVIQILREPETDIKAKTAKVSQYWSAQQAEITRIKNLLEREMSAATRPEDKEQFARHFEKFLYRLREMQALLREQGIEL